MSEERQKALFLRAQAEARKASWLFTAPNPRVGAIALQEGHVVGRGFHRVFGGPHAEEMALRDAGAWCEKSNQPLAGFVDEMMITLEPCCKPTATKKRRPCTDLLLEAGVRKVTFGLNDPNDSQTGAAEKLNRAGVQVATLREDRSFRRLNPAFFRYLTCVNRPWIFLKWASSLDGKMATSGGVSQWITGQEARQEVHQLRAISDAILIGKTTLIEDDPSLTARITPPSAKQPLRVLLDPPSTFPANAKILQGDAPRLWVLEDGPQKVGAWPIEDAVVRVPRLSGNLCLTTLVEKLATEFSVRRLMVEGGAKVHGSFLAEGLVDAIVRYEAPFLLGGPRCAVDGPSFSSPQDALHLVSEETAPLGRDVRRALCVPPTA